MDDHTADETFRGDANKDKCIKFFHGVKSVGGGKKMTQRNLPSVQSEQGINDVIGKWKAVCLVFVIGWKQNQLCHPEQVESYAMLKLLHKISTSTLAASPDPRVGSAVNHKDAFIPDPGGFFSFHYGFCSLLELESLNSWMEATFTHHGYPQQVALLKAEGG